MLPLPRFWHWHTVIALAIFFAIRSLSFFFVGYPTINTFVALTILLSIISFSLFRPHLGLIALIGELLLGGSGQFFEIGTLSLRTLLLVSFLLIWGVHVVAKRQRPDLALPQRPVFFSMIALLGVVVLSFVVGVAHHPTISVVQDVLPFAYLLLIFPIIDLSSRWRSQDYDLLLRLLFSFLLGSALLSLALFLAFSNDLVVIHSPSYNWIRDVALGKITDLGTGFFRIVLPEHLLLPTVLLVIAWTRIKLKRDGNNGYSILFLIMLFFTAVPLMLNFSRAYLLGIAVGLFVLRYKTPTLLWIRECIFVGALLLLTFAGLNLIGSHGKDAGLGLLGLRFGGIVAPQSEESTSTRSLLLPPIFHLIQKNPLFGSGLGASITFWNPFLKQYTTTRHFDWGYLEIVAEMGALGLLAFFSYIISLGLSIQKKAVALLSPLCAMLVIQIFTPALFHVFGVLTLVFMTVAVHASLGQHASSPHTR